MLTNETSKIVGTMLKRRAAKRKLIPRLPLSIAWNEMLCNNYLSLVTLNSNEESRTLDRAPVCLFRWKERSKECRCRKTFLAMARTECCDTLENTAFLSSLKPKEQQRAMPSETERLVSRASCRKTISDVLTSDQQGDGCGEHGSLGTTVDQLERGAQVAIQVIYGRLEEEGNADVQHLGGHEQPHSGDNPLPYLRFVLNIKMLLNKEGYTLNLPVLTGGQRYLAR